MKALRSSSESKPLVDPEDLTRAFSQVELYLLVFISLLDCFARFFYN